MLTSYADLDLPTSLSHQQKGIGALRIQFIFPALLSPPLPPLHYDTMDCVQKMSTSPTCPRVESRKVGRFPNLGQKYPRLSWSLDLNLYSWVGSLKSSYLLSILIKVRQSLAAEASGVV